MNQLHPVMKQALAPFMPVMQRCSHSAPRPTGGAQEFTHTLGDVELTCHIDYTAACRGSRECGVPMEPDEPERADLTAAFVRDVDVKSFLSDGQVAEIEEAFLCQGADE